MAEQARTPWSSHGARNRRSVFVVQPSAVGSSASRQAVAALALIAPPSRVDADHERANVPSELMPAAAAGADFPEDDSFDANVHVPQLQTDPPMATDVRAPWQASHVRSMLPHVPDESSLITLLRRAPMGRQFQHGYSAPDSGPIHDVAVSGVRGPSHDLGQAYEDVPDPVEAQDMEREFDVLAQGIDPVEYELAPEGAADNARPVEQAAAAAAAQASSDPPVGLGPVPVVWPQRAHENVDYISSWSQRMVAFLPLSPGFLTALVCRFLALVHVDFLVLLFNIRHFVFLYIMCWFTSSKSSYAAADTVMWIIAVVFGFVQDLSSPLHRSLRKAIQTNASLRKALEYDVWVMCPTCFTPYIEADCILPDPKHPGEFLARVCKIIEFPEHAQSKYRGPCNTPLVTWFRTGKNKFILRPKSSQCILWHGMTLGCPRRLGRFSLQLLFPLHSNS